MIMYTAIIAPSFEQIVSLVSFSLIHSSWLLPLLSLGWTSWINFYGSFVSDSSSFSAHYRSIRAGYAQCSRYPDLTTIIVPDKVCIAYSHKQIPSVSRPMCAVSSRKFSSHTFIIRLRTSSSATHHSPQYTSTLSKYFSQKTKHLFH